jgi:predicted oxidoreductase (fatty acid repression mutant protein)
MEFFEVIKKRRAVRQYKADPVNKEDILKILDAANWAPSAMNMQQWEFIVVSGVWKNKMGYSIGDCERKPLALQISLHDKGF